MELAKRVKDKMEELLESSPERYVNYDNGVELNEEKLIQDAYESVADSDDDIPDDVYAKITGGFTNRLAWRLEEQYKESQAYSKDPFAYNGLSRKDFH